MLIQTVSHQTFESNQECVAVLNNLLIACCNNRDYYNGFNVIVVSAVLNGAHHGPINAPHFPLEISATMSSFVLVVNC